MDDFNTYASNSNTNSNQDLMDMVKSLAGKFDGKSTNDILSAIYKEAKKGKKQGTLTNAQIENFARTLSPFLDEKQRGYLKKIVEELKKL